MHWTRSWIMLGAVGLSASLQPYLGCLPEPMSETRFEGSPDALADVQSEVVVPTLDAFLSEMEVLKSSLEATTDDRAASREAFLAALDVWQELEVMQLGPAGPLDVIGGAGLRDEVYSWPTVNPCRIDQITAEESYADPDFFEVALVNGYGLDAIEYLLWASPGDNACPAFVSPNEGGVWDALDLETIEARRVDYAIVATDGVIAAAEAIREGWTAEGGFGENLASAGAPSSDFGSDTEALNAVFDAMFYLEKTTKDAKLAVPLGLRPDECSTACEERVELPRSEASTRAIVANLRGFRRLFTGGEGAGFDDLLVAQGYGTLVDQVLADTDAAIALGDETAPLSTLLPDDDADGIALHEAVKRVTDAVKGDLATLMTLEIPVEAAGDND